MTWKTGDLVVIDCDGQTIDGYVSMASPNGKSLFLHFGGIVAGYVGMMPLLMDGDGEYRTIFGDPLLVTLRPPKDKLN